MATKVAVTGLYSPATQTMLHPYTLGSYTAAQPQAPGVLGPQAVSGPSSTPSMLMLGLLPLPHGRGQGGGQMAGF